MKIAYIMNCIDRFKVTRDTTEANLKCAGVQPNLIIVTDNGSKNPHLHTWIKAISDVAIFHDENIGNPQALNNAIEIAFKDNNCDAVCIMGNDLKMPDKWLSEAVRVSNEIPTAGLIGWSWRGVTSEPKNGVHVIEQDQMIFGSWFQTRKTWERCGYFSTFSKYGLWDSDFNLRVHVAGFKRCYIQGMESKHLVNDVGENSEYRKMKDEELKKASKPMASRMKAAIEEGKYFVTKNNKLI